MNSKALFKRFSLVGPGGIRCQCCVSPGFVPCVKRNAKRRLQAFLAKDIRDALVEI